MSNNKLKALPKTIHKATGLEYVEAHHNKLKSLPKTIGKCQAMEMFDVSHNVLKKLPKSVYMVPGRLDASSNDLGSLPKIKFKAKKRGAIAHMNLANNRLKQLPAQLHQLVRLSTLNLENNGLESLPESLLLLLLLGLR